MKFIVSSSSLLKHLQQISGVINANTVLPILEDFLFEIEKNKLNVVVIVHGAALYALYNNGPYKKKYGLANPNIPLINELMKNGVKFIACGQAMNFFEVKKEEMVPNVRISLTAQTVLSHYQLKGYVWYPIEDKE